MADNKAIKSWVDSLSLLDEEDYRNLSHLTKWGAINPENDIASSEEYKYDGVKSYKTPEEIINIYNQTGWVPCESLDFSKLFPKQDNSASGYVRAPKFGVKHLK